MKATKGQKKAAHSMASADKVGLKSGMTKMSKSMNRNDKNQLRKLAKRRTVYA